MWLSTAFKDIDTSLIQNHFRARATGRGNDDFLKEADALSKPKTVFGSELRVMDVPQGGVHSLVSWTSMALNFKDIDASLIQNHFRECGAGSR